MKKILLGLLCMSFSSTGQAFCVQEFANVKNTRDQQRTEANNSVVLQGLEIQKEQYEALRFRRREVMDAGLKLLSREAEARKKARDSAYAAKIAELEKQRAITEIETNCRAQAREVDATAQAEVNAETGAKITYDLGRFASTNNRANQEYLITYRECINSEDTLAQKGHLTQAYALALEKRDDELLGIEEDMAEFRRQIQAQQNFALESEQMTQKSLESRLAAQRTLASSSISTTEKVAKRNKAATLLDCIGKTGLPLLTGFLQSGGNTQVVEGGIIHNGKVYTSGK